AIGETGYCTHEHDVFKDAAFVEKFKKAPAAMHTHHAWLGGLMEHTLDIVALCEQCCKAYLRINRDLVVAGALLHDLGKLDEYEVGTTIRTTPVGILVGHLTLEVAAILRYKGRTGVDDNTLFKLAHMVISHHGSLEFGSPKIPAFPEALLLSYIDALDARMARMYGLMDEADPHSFETYDKKESRNIYLR
ncbi:MAG: HD domain-containing protein, partial [Nanoarchaeota archaeon]